ncbi:hypothetical protein [Deinococcus cellulosilyticus]|uniref:Uncharacterized protein n=1 Tax=Deinococcus cellulosilyticus (strain DSM 18568 / NBRC 106333 / KACC 11606 / 5516J-15) TaxID=1223518 RepID=A0A511N430_DEIC1|nr:hypothetical protein [Deinococcus cellulosilyticus]GEM47634.1 hypothetical protein DC3_32690 [Deinococcus cellulosilyticus NBRC 106333 = KACC 11606]
MITDLQKQNWRSLLSPFFFEQVAHLESLDVEFAWKDNTNRRVEQQDYTGPERRRTTEEFQAIFQGEVIAYHLADAELETVVESVITQAVMHMRGAGYTIPTLE